MGVPKTWTCCKRESSSFAHAGAEISASKVAAKYRMMSPCPGESANQSGEMGLGTAELERRLARNQAMEFSCAIVSIVRPSIGLAGTVPYTHRRTRLR